MGVGGQWHVPANLPLGKRPVTHCTGGWVGPKTSVDRCTKSLPHQDSFDPQTVQTVVSHYTDYVIPVHIFAQNLLNKN
jgi:hypothetical protein